MRLSTILATSVAAIALTAGAAAAQEAPADGASQVDDVIVTARKREERLQDVPIAVTAVSGETLEREQINVIKDVAGLTPGLNISSDAVGRAFNLGGATEISIADLARRIIEITESSSEIEYIRYEDAYPAGFEDMRRRVPDNSRSKALIGFEPRTGVDDIIKYVAADLAWRYAMGK